MGFVNGYCASRSGVSNYRFESRVFRHGQTRERISYTEHPLLVETVIDVWQKIIDLDLEANEPWARSANKSTAVIDLSGGHDAIVALLAHLKRDIERITDPSNPDARAIWRTFDAFVTPYSTVACGRIQRYPREPFTKFARRCVSPLLQQCAVGLEKKVLRQVYPRQTNRCHALIYMANLEDRVLRNDLVGKVATCLSLIASKPTCEQDEIPVLLVKLDASGNAFTAQRWAEFPDIFCGPWKSVMLRNMKGPESAYGDLTNHIEFEKRHNRLRD
ncbi:hypothetical protein PLEOSDRAFT_1086498 [Pleurotus ostreatus PC15]|uniref:Uncharacterized protein n=1 Tax=Pleurotus ostreatus (strain PC15) TaxID=1137138 RepID=A0A067N4U4_PLEO1|nr:hypothetical protein PLEOSDRAFT_1086498 [Pleurotus ostreatus PC15]